MLALKLPVSPYQVTTKQQQQNKTKQTNQQTHTSETKMTLPSYQMPCLSSFADALSL